MHADCEVVWCLLFLILLFGLPVLYGRTRIDVGTLFLFHFVLSGFFCVVTVCFIGTFFFIIDVCFFFLFFFVISFMKVLFLLALRHKVLCLAYVWSVVSVAPALNIVFWVGEFNFFFFSCAVSSCD